MITIMIIWHISPHIRLSSHVSTLLGRLLFENIVVVKKIPSTGLKQDVLHQKAGTALHISGAYAHRHPFNADSQPRSTRTRLSVVDNHAHRRASAINTSVLDKTKFPNSGIEPLPWKGYTTFWYRKLLVEWYSTVYPVLRNSTYPCSTANDPVIGLASEIQSRCRCNKTPPHRRCRTRRSTCG